MRAIEQGMRAIKQGMRAIKQGLRAIKQGLRATEQGKLVPSGQRAVAACAGTSGGPDVHKLAGQN
jgi:predicted transcriptional regulator